MAGLETFRYFFTAIGYMSWLGRRYSPYPYNPSDAMKYNLFPKLHFLDYVKRIHVSYHPGREQVETARQLILQITSDSTKRKFPKLEASWELLGYDAPAVVDIELVNGATKRFLADHYSRCEMQAIIDQWQYTAHMEHMKQHSLEKLNDEE
jgi:hypothetical protein